MSKKVRRLFEIFQPQNYNLEINPDRDTMQFSGTVTITGRKTGRPSQRFTFHQKDLKITEAAITHHEKAGDQPVKVVRIVHQNSFDEVRLHSEHLLHAGAYTITMRFEGKITDGMHGIYPCHYELKGKKQKLVATQFESHHAREAFPCIDEPEAKATFDLTLLSPKNEVALANTPVKTQEEKDGKLVTVFETTPKMSTYLLAFVYGDLQSKEVSTKDDVIVRVWSTKAQPKNSLDFGLDVAKRTIEFFNDYFGVAYPLPKCDLVSLPDFSSAAMENWGLITFREPYLLADPSTTSQSAREVIATVIAHEVSHQWFGNLVTMKWWDDLWLNESFANVMEYVATEGLFPEWEIWNTFTSQEGLAAIRRDSIAGVQAVKCRVRHPDEISTLFDPSIVYAKGGRLLNMLMNYLGEKDFRRGLKIYFKKHAYGNTTGDDLWAALSEASHKDVASFMNPWLNHSGLPMVSVTQHDNKVEISQSQFLLDMKKADTSYSWPVPLLSSNENLPELLDKPQIKLKLASDEFIRINEDAVGHYIVNYTELDHRKAIADLVLNRQLGIAERLMLLSDSSMLSRAGTQSFAATMQLLESYILEDSEPVWEIIALIYGDCRRFVDLAPEIEEPIKASIRKIIEAQFERLGSKEVTKESNQDTKLRATILALGSYSDHSKISKALIEDFKKYKTDKKAVSSELRGIVFGAAVRKQIKGAFDYLLELEEKTTNVDLKQEIMGALTLTTSEDEIQLLLERIEDQEKVRLHDVDHWLVYLLRNRYGREQTWNWLRENWGWLEKTFESDKSYDNLPRYAAGAFSTRKLLEEYKEFFEPKADQPALKRNITMGIEEIENRVAWLESDLKSIKKYFDQ